MVRSRVRSLDSSQGDADYRTRNHMDDDTARVDTGQAGLPEG